MRGFLPFRSPLKSMSGDGTDLVAVGDASDGLDCSATVTRWL